MLTAAVVSDLGQAERRMIAIASIGVPRARLKKKGRPMKGARAKNRQRVALYDGPDPIDVHVGKRIRQRRSELGLTQEAVAAQIGVRLATVQKYEAARHRTSASMLYRICRALNVGPAYFFRGFEESERAKRPRRGSDEAL